ncbi:hypothetical protein HN695_04290 [Candidatus Woesearchaeota archaeon]|jgi:hypothetical protein|nr:hypothetical protein [Candidatus Woesearchaeota archaeon]MBT5272369.1 hypothetical protein [Candidatus Woesearchaeota archaeon]MBT6040598.1 hypothetical protein [Candidatus Woesearchaeota archaeon]MBT6336641.1 hypothetical protein [Candidatus Woesearchaeota archaeon]MBT7927531.1 hypothetical protein [Candidatus Woesearchaeota archaeon]
MKELIDKAKLFAMLEIEEHGTPALEHFELSNKMGQELAEKHEANKDLVMLGTILMDVKLGECIKEGKVKEHIERSADATEKFLTDLNVDEETKEKILNCVRAHHGTAPFDCIEAEVCANADCYRFLTPKGIFTYFRLLGNRFDDLTPVLDQVVMKMEEKWNVLTFDECKKELEPYFNEFQELIKKAKE